MIIKLQQHKADKPNADRQWIIRQIIINQKTNGNRNNETAANQLEFKLIINEQQLI